MSSRSDRRDKGDYLESDIDPFRVGTVGIGLGDLSKFLTTALGTDDLTEIDEYLTAWRTAKNEGSSRQERTPYPVQVRPTAVDTKGHTLNIAYQLSEDVLLKSITGYRDVSQVTRNAYAGAFGGGFTNLPTGDIIDQSQWSQEFQIVGQTSDGGIRYVGGIYYYEEEVNERQGDFRTHYVSLLDILGADPAFGAALFSGDPATIGAAIGALAAQPRSRDLSGPRPGTGAAIDGGESRSWGLCWACSPPASPTTLPLPGDLPLPPRAGVSFLASPLLDSDGNPIVAKTQGRVSDITPPDQPIGPYLTEIEAEADSLAI